MNKLLFLLALAACGSVSAHAPDAATADAPGDTADTAPVAPARGAAVLSGAGHMTGATWSADVQIGLPFEARPTAGSADQLTTAATLSP